MERRALRDSDLGDADTVLWEAVSDSTQLAGYDNTTTKIIARLDRLKAITKDEKNPWTAPAFIFTKSDRTVLMQCDSCRLNQGLVRQTWPLPKISEIFRSVPRFGFVTVLDLNMVLSD